MTINVLGTEYTITIKKYDEDPAFDRRGVAGYCDGSMHRIVVCDMSTYHEMAHEQEDTQLATQRDLLRHEIVHAFLYESGLDANSYVSNEGWAINEEMVDWFATQGAKIYSAWMEAGALEMPQVPKLPKGEIIL